MSTLLGLYNSNKLKMQYLDIQRTMISGSFLMGNDSIPIVELYCNKVGWSLDRLTGERIVENMEKHIIPKICLEKGEIAGSVNMNGKCSLRH